MMIPTRPLLRYYGGKWLLAPWIIGHFPPHRAYVEPYGGAASVLLQKPRSYAEVYNDLDGEVVNLFRIMRSERAAELLEALRLTPFARDEYESCREYADDPFEQARRLVVRSFMGFGSNATNRRRNTGFRSNSNRSGTTPALDWMNLPEKLIAVVDRLRGVVIENRPAIEIIRQHDRAETLFYCDPPYVAVTRSHLMHEGSCYAHEMTDEDHREMAEVLNSVAGAVIVSGYPSELYDEIFRGWRKVLTDAHADGARDRTEALWLNARAWAGLQHGPLFAAQLDRTV